MSRASDGLGDQWGKIVTALSTVIPVYDRMNRIMSFGKDAIYRVEGIRRTIQPDDFVLDLGCGPGVMSELALKTSESLHDIVLLDVLRPMLKAAKKRVKVVGFVLGVFENLPFRSKVFDVVMCGFSIRDARNLSSALMEISRVLKRTTGRLLVVDLGKPDNIFLKLLIGAYWMAFVPLLAILLVGRRGFSYPALFTTYWRLPRNSKYFGILATFFSKVNFETRMLGGAVIATAREARAVR